VGNRALPWILLALLIGGAGLAALILWWLRNLTMM